jgi:uncharacterized RDD family membrane protein YckC
MNTRRFLAYFIDIVVLSIIVALLSRVSFLNPYYDKYNDRYDEYLELNDKYQDGKIEYDEYIEEYKSINYDMEKYSLYSASIYVVVYLLYFVGFNYITKGQTLGKKMLRLRIVDYKDKESNPKIWRYLVRCLILYGLIFKIPLLVLVNVSSIDLYNTVYNIMYYLQYLLMLVIFIMVILRKDGRSLHDIVSGTIVLDVNNIENGVLEENRIIDADYTEISK